MMKETWKDDGGGWIASDNGDPIVEYAGCGTHDAHWRSKRDFRLALAAPSMYAILSDLTNYIDSGDLQAIAEIKKFIEEA